MDLLLAAYGTLRPGCGGQDFLGIELPRQSSCTLHGRLWLVQEKTPTGDVRLVPAFYPEEEGVVQADLLQVPEEAWGALDRFEDFIPHNNQSPYIREETLTLEGESVWTYRAQNIDRINYLRDGDWVRYASHPRAIPLFRASKILQ